MKSLNILSTVFLTAIMVTGCQAGGGIDSSEITLSLEEVKLLEVEFGNNTEPLPNRNINDIRKRFSQPFEISLDCSATGPKYDPTAQNIGKLWEKAQGQIAKSSKAYIYGDIDLAMQLAKHADKIFPSNWEKARSVVKFNLAMFYGFSGDRASAASNYGHGAALLIRGLKKSRNTSIGSKVTKTTHKTAAQAIYLFVEGRYREAEMLLEQIKYWGNGGDSNAPGEIIAYYRGLAVLKQGRIGEAEEIFRDNLLRWSRSRPIVAIWYFNGLTEVLLAQGRTEDAVWTAQKAMESHAAICIPVQNFTVVKSNRLLAEAYAANDQWDMALATFEKTAQELAQTNKAAVKNLMTSPDWGISLMVNGKYRDAKEKLGITISILTTAFGEDSYNTLEARAMMDLTQAMMAEQSGKQTAISTLENTIDKLIDSKALQTEEDKRNRVHVGRLAVLVESHLGLVVNSSNITESSIAKALRYTQLGQGSAVQAALSSSAFRMAARDPELKIFAKQHQDIGNRLGELRNLVAYHATNTGNDDSANLLPILKTELQTLNAAYATLGETIENGYPEYAQLTSSTLASAADVIAQMEIDEAVLLYHLTTNRGYIWAISPDKQLTFTQIKYGKKQLGAMITELRGAVDPKDMRSLADIPVYDVALANQIYNILLKPVETSWLSAKNLIIVADGPMRQLPLSMLVKSKHPQPTPDSAGMLFAEYKDIDWLANSHAVTVLPALKSFVDLRAYKAIPADKPFIGFGDPYFNVIQAAEAAQEAQSVQVAELDTRSIKLRSAVDTRGLDSATLARLPRLADTAPELQNIATALGANPDTDVYLGLEATEDRVSSMDLTPYRVVAFATHGLQAGDLDGLYQPALALTSPKVTKGEGDGLLSLGDILGLSLNADWVVLSACNTASADGAGGEAVSGLGRAFFSAGTRAVLVSNWPVHSVATRELTTALFSNQQFDSGISRAEALRLARVKLIEEGTFKNANGKELFSYAHPIFWAPFTVVGDGGPLNANTPSS